MICLGVGLFRFILLRTLYASCTWMSVPFFRFGELSAIILSYTFLTPFSLYSPSETLIMRMLVHLMLFQRSLKLFLFFLMFAVLIGWFPLFCLLDHLCVLLYHLVCCSFLPVCFYFSYYIFHFWLILLICYSSLLKFSLWGLPWWRSGWESAC